MIKTILKHYFIDKVICYIFDNLIDTFKQSHPIDIRQCIDGKTYSELYQHGINRTQQYTVITYNAIYRANRKGFEYTNNTRINTYEHSSQCIQEMSEYISDYTACLNVHCNTVIIPIDKYTFKITSSYNSPLFVDQSYIDTIIE